MKNDLSLKDLATWGLVALGFATQWGVMTSKVNALERKVDTVAEIQGDLRALKEVALDSRNRIVRIENLLIKP